MATLMFFVMELHVEVKPRDILMNIKELLNYAGILLLFLLMIFQKYT